MVFLSTSILLLLVGCQQNTAGPAVAPPKPVVVPSGMPMPVLQGASPIHLPPYPPVGEDGDVTARLQYLVDNNPSTKVNRLRRALADGVVSLNAADTGGGAATFHLATRQETPVDWDAAKPFYTVSVSERLLRGQLEPMLVVDMLITVAHESVHVAQCLDRGDCPTGDRRPFAGDVAGACEAKWQHEHEAYVESCTLLTGWGFSAEPHNCSDPSVVDELEWGMFQQTGQFAGAPECQSTWSLHAPH